MPRRLVELSDLFPYHVCARSNNKDWYQIPMPYVFRIYERTLRRTHENYGLECHAFVLMANHFHMLVSTPRCNLSQAMRYFMTESSRLIARTCNRINRIYGARYHWTIIRHENHYAHAFKYIYNNPVRAQIVGRVEEYKWSTMTLHPDWRDIITSNQNGFDELLPKQRCDLLLWLNLDDEEEYFEAISKALRKHEFAFKQNRRGKRSEFIDSLPPKNTPGTF